MEEDWTIQSSRRRSQILLQHLTEASKVAEVEPTNRIFLSQTSASSNANEVTVRIGDVSLVVPRPQLSLCHIVPALYLGRKGQVS